ncbi:MAG: queuosine precursor transporter [Paludibacter sp.]
MKKQVSLIFMVCGLLFTVCLITANIVSQKLIRVYGFDLTAGVIIFPLVYVLNDIIAEVWGYRKMRLIIWMGFMMNFFVIFIFRLTIWAPSSPHFIYQNSLTLTLLTTERFTVASFIAFLIGSFINAYVMSKMKIRQHGRNFGLRAIVSTILGEGADSFIFLTIALAGHIRHHHLIVMIFTQIAFKTAYEIIVLPLTTYLVKRIKKHEHTDIIDHEISYNPFKVKEV